VPPDVMVWPWLSCLLLPALMVSVAANVAPTFLPNMSAVNLPEDLPVGAEVFWLIAQDQDNDPLTYGISGSYEYFFNVTPNTGEVKLAKLLDYETLYWFAINIFVNDGHNNPVQMEMQVIVEDRNDNAPIFQNTDFSTSISETLPVGSLLLSVLAKDKDTGSGGAVVYSIEKVIPSTDSSEYLFRILPNGSIILNGSLSYNNKSAFYQLELKACDSGGRYNNSFVVQCSSPVFVSISVIDKPDLDPQFVREFYSASVAEDAPQGTSVLKVEAMDGDRGINDPVIYSISNSTRPGWFEIGPDGVIRVSGSLDREQLLEEDEEVQVQVTATEMDPNIYGQEAKVSIWVTLRVTDVNDHKPEFYNCSLPTCTFTPQEAQVNFTGYVDEHASTRIPIDDLTMVVYDPDKAGALRPCAAWVEVMVGRSLGGKVASDQQSVVPQCSMGQCAGSNGTFLLSLGGPDVEAFSVSPERAVGSVDVQVLVRAPSLVDYETQTVMLVQVVATDSVSRSSSVALVTIHLRDINDHRPTFPHNLYNLSVFEHSAVGYVVTNSIRVNSGTVTVRNSELLDREKQAVYYLTLLATDGGNLSSSTMLQIVVLDINDNKPVVSGSYNIFVQEEEGNVSVTIQAHDNDQPGTNHSLLHFSLLSSPNSHNFSVDPDKGILRNLGPLDREAINPTLGGRIVLTVRVSDCGEPALWTDVNVTITVEDINDNLPIFNQSSYSFSVRERDPGVLVGVVEAWDADQTEANNRISFSLSGGGANNFLLRGLVLGSGRAEGHLQLPSGVSLDYETQDSFSLTVSAENPDPQGRDATAKVLVNVEDDRDTMSQVEVQLVNVICTKAGVDVGSLCHGWFSVLANGSVFISQSEVIDYETCDLVTLVVRAYDLTTDPRFQAYSDNGSLPITIEDVKGRFGGMSPELGLRSALGQVGTGPDPTDLFLSTPVVIIPELVIPNQQVASVQARDDDSGNNGAILFSILQVDFIAKDGAVIPFRGFFRVSTSLEASVFIGNIECTRRFQGDFSLGFKTELCPPTFHRLVTNLDSTLQGTYQVTVKAQDRSSEGPAQEATITLNLFTVDQSYRVRLQFSMSKEEVGANTEEIKAALVQATRTTVYIGSQGDQESEFPDTLRNIVIGLGVALLLVIVIMTTVLVCTQKSANPVLNLPTKDLGFESQSSSSDLDHISHGGGNGMVTVMVVMVMMVMAMVLMVMVVVVMVMVVVMVVVVMMVVMAMVVMVVVMVVVVMVVVEVVMMMVVVMAGLHYLPYSLNSLDDNSVDLENSRQEIKARWGMSWCLGLLTWGSSLKEWVSGQSSRDLLLTWKEPLHSLMGPDPEPLNRVLSEMKAGTHGQQKEELAFTNPGLNTTDL
ncbi:hypothetical protein E2I00_006811, partial [Balaenoptera physalus]